MTAFKVPNFEQRAAASKAAKVRALEKLRAASRSIEPTTPVEPRPASSREMAAADRRAAHQATIEAAKAARAELRARGKASEKVEIATHQPAPVSTAPTPDELKASRDARYAARKDRKRR